ncbi:MAG: DUF3302 domain-containing protein [Gammaproteobacteria bacterium]|jgi:hypothetical protein
MLDYVALGILIFAAITLFYGIIVIHDIPYDIAVHRNHPHQDAIHYAGWVSLFTLHALWPFLWIWATLYREDRGWGLRHDGLVGDAGEDAATAPESGGAAGAATGSIDHRLEALEDRIERIEQAIMAAGDTQK